jgi:hypothetical protein
MNFNHFVPVSIPLRKKSLGSYLILVASTLFVPFHRRVSFGRLMLTHIAHTTYATIAVITRGYGTATAPKPNTRAARLAGVAARWAQCICAREHESNLGHHPSSSLIVMAGVGA